jgi:transposase
MSAPDPAAAGLPPTAAAALPGDVATLQRMVLELLATLHEQRRDNEALRHRLDVLLRRLYGPRGERYDPDQLLLFAQAARPAPADAAGATDMTGPAAKSPRRCRPHGRRRLPEDLPRESRHHQLAEAERLCAGCGRARVEIGADRSEQLEYRPASLFVVEHIVHKYACPCGGRRPAPASGLSEIQESGPMSSHEPQPPPPPAPAATSARPAPVSPGPQPAGQGPSPSAPAEPLRLSEPVAVVVAAAKPPMPIAKGLPGPGLLAHLIVSKYTDHLPLHRLERVYERQGVFLHRSTLSDWLAACAQLLRPLYDLMVSVVLRSRALHTDDTTVKLQDPVTHRQSTARLWGYLGDAAHPYNVFDFTATRKRDGPERFLADYQGYLHADAFSGYDGLYLPDPRTAQARITEVACNAHARRKFYEARASDALRAHQALAYYGQLYELERAAKDFSDGQRLQMRQGLSVPILEQFHQWLLAQRPEVLPKSPMGEAIGYALNNWEALRRYTEAGFLAIDNNVAEREMKQIAIGRKNWLSVGSPRGGQTAAVLLSFTATCRRLGVEPWGYLQEVLTRLPSLPKEQLGELLPDRWEAARRARQAPPAPAPSSPPPSAESAS